jgi:fructokinase
MRIGIDLGGTKIEAVALDRGGTEFFRERVPTPRHDYDATIRAVAELSKRAAGHGAVEGVGLAIPGCVSKITGLIKNANSTWLNGRALAADLAAALNCPVALSNDANCFVLSEATDGAGAGADVVFGVIAGTGVGGGICVHGKVLEGPHGLAGEWGHNPLPWMSPEEWAEAPDCYCGKRGCIETWVSGPGLAADFVHHPLRPSLAREPATATSPAGAERAGEADLGWTAEDIAKSNEPAALAAMARFTDRFARALASVVNILDPDVIVLGGGISNIENLYRDLPPLVARYAFTIEGAPKIVKNRHGDSSGVRGAAWLAPR